MTVVRRATRGTPGQASYCAAQPEPLCTLLPEPPVPLEVGDDLGARVFALSQEELGLVFDRLCPAHGPAAMDLEAKEEKTEKGAVAKVEDAMEVTEEVPECDTEEETEADSEGECATPFEGRFALRLE